MKYVFFLKSINWYTLESTGLIFNLVWYDMWIRKKILEFLDTELVIRTCHSIWYLGGSTLETHLSINRYPQIFILNVTHDNLNPITYSTVDFPFCLLKDNAIFFFLYVSTKNTHSFWGSTRQSKDPEDEVINNNFEWIFIGY